MIPKIIHFCWFGNNPKSDSILKCIASWKKICPEFEIIEWNEKNALIYSNKFYEDALRKKKYAFASDYIRTKVLYEFGGVYMDTDMLLIKKINDDLLNFNFFAAEEEEGVVNYAMFGGVKHHHFFKQMLDFYDATEFNVFSLPIITQIFIPIINKNTLKEKEVILEYDTFYPLHYKNREEDFTNYVTPNTIAIHLWDLSWKVKPKDNLKLLFKNCLIIIIDFLFYGYSYHYFKRYFREYSRKIYNALKLRLKSLINIH